MSRKKLFIVFTVVAVLLIVLAVLLTVSFLGSSKKAGASPYSAVYLSTGDVYFGKLSWFPAPHLTNVWFLQRTANQQMALAPFISVTWSPVDELYLSSKNIVFWTRLQAGSQIVQAMENPTAAQQQVPSGTPSSTSK
jgi:hypothetical protein